MRALFRLIPTSMAMSLVRVVGSAIAFVTQVLLARLLDPSQLGIFYFVTSMATVAALILGSGYPSLLARFITRYNQRAKPQYLAAFLRMAQLDTIKWTGAGALVLVAAGLLVPNISIETRLAFVFGVLTIVPIAMQRIQSSIAVNYRLFAPGYVPGLFVRPLLFALVLAGLLVFSRQEATVALLTGIQLAAYSAVSFITYLLVRHLAYGPAEPRYDRRLKSRWRREAWPLVIVATFTWLISDLAVILVAPFVSMADVAAFGICIKIAYLVGFTVQVAHEVVLPDLGDALARREGHTLNAKILGASLAPLALTLGGVVAAALFGEYILAVFGEEFRSAKPTLVVLMFVQFVRAVAGPSPLLLTLKGAQTANALICVASAVVLLASSAVFATVWGDEGAAIALLVTTLFWLAASAITLYRLDGARADIAVFLSAAGRTRR